jgi:dihydrofolate synthase
MIHLGLTRIRHLLEHAPLPWRAIHVAGTNGKGSVCAYISAMIKADNVKVGKFTSPHLINRWDCISIDEKTVDERIFHEVELSVRAKDRLLNIKATEFEILTATAFEIFSQEKIEIGVVEVGLGGALDATNILSNPLVTVITHIGIDHQNFLGDSIEKIASHKAGIMKKGVHCVVDGTNPPKIIELFKGFAEYVGARSVISVPKGFAQTDEKMWSILPRDMFESHQQTNICLAFEAVTIALHESGHSRDFTHLLHAIPKTELPGRLQKMSIEALTGRKRTILLDGAHNLQSAEVLANYVDTKLRHGQPSVTWLMAFSRGKNVNELLSTLIRPEDKLVITRFGPVEGMPWVQPATLNQVDFEAQALGILVTKELVLDMHHSLRRATDISDEGPLVIAGSLYLVSDVLRLLIKPENDK